MVSCFALSCILLSARFAASAESAFLGATRVSALEVQQQLHTELRNLLGRGDAADTARLEKLQAGMRSIYSVLPKSAEGKLDKGASRYALHRFFSQQHGWHVRGLDPTGADKWDDAESMVMLEDRIPGYVLQLFEQQHRGGTRLQDLAVLAATLEDLVHSEAMQLLFTSYAAQGLEEDETLDDSVKDMVVATYLLFHIMPNPKYAGLSTQRLNQLLAKVPKFYSGWEDTVMWVQDLKGTMDYRQYSQLNPFNLTSVASHSFDSLVSLVEGVGEHYGQFQNLECREMKSTLLEMGDGSGRVRLPDFYSAAFENQSSHFSESPEYLRHLGVLDETDPKQPSVIITNYMYSRANCVASSSFYSICCIDQCEALMANLESSISNPLADPQTLANLVSRMPSDTIDAPRNLSAPMRRRLEDIATRHGGNVPLYGRLFAQWMHHAFPNECPYPQAPGSLASPLTPTQWLQSEPDLNRRVKASKDEMQSIMETALTSNASDADAADLGLTLPWTEDEELLLAIPGIQPRGRVKSLFRVAVLALAISSAAAGLLKMLGAAPTAAMPMSSRGRKHSLWSVACGSAKESDFV